MYLSKGCINWSLKRFAFVIVLGILQVSTAVADFLNLPEVKEMQDPRGATYLKDLDVPGVKERSPDPSAGPRLAVTEFRIQGLVEYPELGITRDALNQLVESIRFDIMGEGKLLESGYTVEEISQISDLLVEIEKETLDRHVTNLDLQKLVWLVREQQGKRGVTLGQIEAVAAKITQFYRERGFILAKAYIPKQQVRDGIVNLTLLLGHLGEVNVINNTKYSNDKIKTVFDDLITKPVTTAAVEERLYLINDFPGITVDGYFEPGYQVGDTRLNINVKNERRLNANVRFDNHGGEDTGLYRIYGDVQFNNLIGYADALSLAALTASSPSNTTYYRVKYSTDFFSPRIKLDVEVSKNQFLVDQTSLLVPLEINGEVDVVSIGGRYIFKRSRTHNTNLELRYEDIKSDLNLGDFPTDTNDEELHNYIIAYNFDFLQEAKVRLHQGNIKLTNGAFDFRGTINTEQRESYNILSANYSMLTFWNLPFTDIKTRLITRVNAQYAGYNLSSIMRFSLAGPTRARGFEPSLFTADDAVYIGADVIFNAPEWFEFEISGLNFKNIAKPFVFADIAYGKQYTLQSGENDATGLISDAGFGLQFVHGGNIQSNLMLAFPIQDNFKNLDSPVEPDNVRLVFDFQYSF